MAEAKATEPDAVLVALRTFVRQVAEEVVRAALPACPTVSADALDENTQREIREQAVLSHKTYLTRAQAATYLQVSEKSIGEWSKRPPEENPLPVAYVGADPRYRRTALDEWAAEESRRRLAG